MSPELSTLLDRLNPAQKDAATNLYGPELIVAGAGSGKTSVLTARIALLLDSGILPERILALTFTKKAAGEMKSRIAGLVGDTASRVEMGTFHSVFIRILRPYAHLLGFRENFTVSDEDDSLSRLKKSIKAVLVSHRPAEDTWSKEQKEYFKKEDKQYKAKEVASIISRCKNDLITAAAYAQDRRQHQYDVRMGRPHMAEIFSDYCTSCFTQGVMDYDDILLYMDILLYNSPQARMEIAARYDFILVDEYQDTNVAQYSILKRLTEQNRNICVVGDDSQSIYAFRGARIENILNFKRDYEGAKVFYLEQNYRSTQTIVNAANRLIEHNGNRIPKICFSTAEEGEPIFADECETEKAEAAHIVEEILSRKKNGADWKDIAVLYRTNAQSMVLEDALVRKGIPYIVYSGLSFFERMEVKDLLAYFRLAVNPDDNEAFLRVVNKPVRGVGDAAKDRLIQYAREHRCSVWSAVNRDDLSDIGLKPKMEEGLLEFRKIILESIEYAQEKNAFGAALEISNLAQLHQEYIGDGSEEALDRANNLRELVDSAKYFEEDTEKENDLLPDEDKKPLSLSAYLENITLLSNADTGTDDEDRISLMTVHCSKGLEFKHVFIAGMEEGLFPLEFEATDRELEEERRLFYVAVTRAKKSVLLTRARQRMKFGQRVKAKESMFVSELLDED